MKICTLYGVMKRKVSSLNRNSFFGLSNYPNCLISRLQNLFRRSNPDRLYDLNIKKDNFTKKHALLSYIVHPFKISKNDPRFLSHINIWHAREMVRVLNRMGYIVDVIDYRDTDFVPHRSYDLFIGHGGINFETIAHQLPGETVKIYFSTGCYWRFHNEQELARFEALKQRRGVELPPDRLIKHSEEGALQAADGIIGIGNSYTRETYKDFSPVIMINGTALIDTEYTKRKVNFERGRDHFLYFAGGGNIHKGLDLLLEAFSELEQHLWVCTKIDPEFAELYDDELHNYSNIHTVGWVQSRSIKFYEIIATCNYVILPSCSEGQAQSVVECMNLGLIPVVSQACGLDVNGYGWILDPCTPDEICRMVRKLSSYSDTQCREMSVKARQAAVTAFSEIAFHQNMRDALQHIIGEVE